MRVLLLGSGGRESALAWALARSASVTEIVATPGNPGIGRVAALEAVDPTDVRAILQLARRVRPDLVVIGPEAPLVAGVGDALKSEDVAVFGPDAGAALIEGSKSYAKELMERAGVPTAAWRSFTSAPDAIAYLDEIGPPYVIKADGLAAGKGVAVTEDRSEAVAAVEERVVGRKFGDAGARVVIEEYLDGEEASLIAFTDGRSLVACEPAQDYKRVFDEDRGANTGGMGSYSPVPACPPELARGIVEEVLMPMVRATSEVGAPFVGALYAGLALTSKGPKVVEFNARFGDPETQALLPRLESDLGEVALACARGDLEGAKLDWDERRCVSVVLASRGYPGSHGTGFVIAGEDAAEALGDVFVFHAGTAVHDGSLITNGGRVLAVSALGDGYAAARARAYEAASLIGFEGKHMRTDIAARAERAEGEA
ncbi:MAG: phosphoribosylamine--glycine ligase [Actinomycetota bacterium]